MRKIKWYCLFVFLTITFKLPAQPPLNNVTFFEEDQLINMDMATDLKKLVTTKKLDTYQPATVTVRFPDSTVMTEDIQLTARGEFRRTNCFMPTMKLDFKNTTSKLAPLRKLKLVCGCSTGPADERLVLKEFLIYKIYNLLTEMSFRVRLLHINYSDTKGKVKSYSQYGFLIEDMGDMAKRNKCKEVKAPAFHPNLTDKPTMNLVDIFQYMIGNTDWSVPGFHNMKLMRPKADTLAPPYPIPYDFDFAGLVNASYATPREELGITSVRERLYRGFPRNMTEIEITLKIFRDKHEDINKLINNFEILDSRSRKDFLKYLDDFYDMIDNKKAVERVFINGARTN
jgi:hypothetical protein